MSEPTTEAGRRLLFILQPDRDIAPVLAEHIPAIEAEARADLARRIEARVAGLEPSYKEDTVLLNGENLHWRDAVLVAIREEAGA